MIKGVNNMAYIFDDNTFSDLYKEAYGSRPSQDNEYYSSAPAEKDRIWRYLCDVADEVQEEEARHASFCVAEFEDLVVKTISLGAGDRATALRWITQNDEIEHIQDVEHFAWEHNILFTPYGKQLVNELMDIYKL